MSGPATHILLKGGKMDLNKIKNDIIPLLEGLELSLYSIDFKEENDVQTLEIIVDKKGDVDIDEITKATELINEYLDKEDPIDSEYQLLIESRGIEREFGIDEVEDYISSYIFVKTVNEELYGDLLSLDGANMLIKNRKNKKIKINLNDVVYLRTAVKF